MMVPSPPPTTSTTTVLRQPDVSAAISRAASVLASSIIVLTGASMTSFLSPPAGMSAPVPFAQKSALSLFRIVDVALLSSGFTRGPCAAVAVSLGGLLPVPTVVRVSFHLPVEESVGACCVMSVTIEVSLPEFDGTDGFV